MPSRNTLAFENLVRAYSADLYRFIYWLSRDRCVAEDIVQETFAKVWKAWHQLRDETAVKAWLFKIARNEYMRTFQRKRIIADVDIEEIDISIDHNIADDLAMRQAVAALPVSYREPLLLQVLGGLSCSEIAESLAITEGAVMTRLTRARQTLRKLWEPESAGGKLYELS